MKLKEYTPDNVTYSRQSTVAICSLNQKSGLFGLNKSACDLIGLAAGDHIILHQDEEDLECWYLEKVKGKGFALRGKKDLKAGVFFNNCSIAKAIAKSLSFEKNTGRLLIAGTPTVIEKNRKLWGFLATHLKSK